MSRIHRTSKWATFTRKVRPIITAQLPLPCVNAYVGKGCTGVVHPGQRFDIAHRNSHHRNPWAPLTIEAVGPAHASCNRTAGGREGRAKQIAVKRDDQRLPNEGSGW